MLDRVPSVLTDMVPNIPNIRLAMPRIFCKYIANFVKKQAKSPVYFEVYVVLTVAGSVLQPQCG